MTSRLTPPLHGPITYHPRHDAAGRRVSLKERVYRILEQPDAADPIAKLWNLVIVGAIVVSTLALIAETVQSIHLQFHPILLILVFPRLRLFRAEYVMRLCAITCAPRSPYALFCPSRFAITPLALLDLVAIPPAFAAAGVHLRF